MSGMATGLEEESKKSLQMEAQLEKQLDQFDTERQQLKQALQRKEERWGFFGRFELSSYCIS